ncbi:MAG: metallophosphoesterase [Oscillospiraceae bacterium]|nr:metallophosphoesterase [Oscillospiraceae bacterium]
MGLYAIGDLHLSFGSDKPMDIFGGGWINYTDKILSGFQNLGPDDLCILCGDISWGMSFEESLEDFLFIDNLPGKKIILKGNHDYWWNTSTKMKAFFEANEIKSINILHNNCFYYNDTAICGTRGWFYDDGLDREKNNKIIAREVIRLRASLQAAGEAETKLCFLHYPPRFKDTVYRDLVTVMQEYGVKKCVYGHIHGEGHRFAVRGEVEGIEYEMVSADYLGFVPLRILA